jgi:transposase
LGNINSTKYNKYILSRVEQFFREHVEEGYIFMQDNAPSHRSYETRTNLYLRQIPYIKFPPYSPDLNLIEHVWNWMKNWIQDHYWQARYNVAKVPLSQLKEIILEAWEAVPEDYI